MKKIEFQRSQNAIRNIMGGLLNRLVSLVLPFAERTVFLYTLGASYLGLNSLYISMLQILNLAEFGIGSAIVYSMYQPVAQNNKELVCALLGLYRKIYRLIGCTILVLGIGIIPFLNQVISQDVPNDVDIHLAYLLFLLNTVIGYFAFSYKESILNAFQRTDIISNISSCTKILQCFIQIYILLASDNYYLYLLVMPMVTLINNIITNHIVNKKFPEYICCGIVPKEIKNDIRQKVFGLFITRICGTTRNALDSICISAFIGLLVNAIYSNYLYVIVAVTTVFNAIGGAIIPTIGNSMVQYDSEKNHNDMRQINFIYMFLSGWATICILCLIQPFMYIWAGSNLLFSFDVAILLVMYFYLLRMGDIRAVYSDAAGLWWESRYRAIIESLMNIVLNIVLVNILGVYGVILATLISLFVVNFCWGSKIVFDYYFKNDKIIDFYKAHFRYLVVNTMVAAITYGICNIVSVNMYIDFIYRVLVCATVPFFLYRMILIRLDEFNEAMSWLLGHIKHINKFGFILDKLKMRS